jgi:hypothetical protein
MIGARHTGAVICALVALSLVSSAALAADVARYAGRTSQSATISFAISRGYVRKLRFTIFIRCPSRRIWRIAASNFEPIKIKRGRFAQKFVARDGDASATVRGRVAGRRTRGTLYDRTYEPRERSFCAGTARFDLRAEPRGRAASRIARSGRRYYDAVSERMAHGPRKEPSKSYKSWIPDSALTAISNGPPGPPRRHPPNR